MLGLALLRMLCREGRKGGERGGGGEGRKGIGREGREREGERKECSMLVTLML